MTRPSSTAAATVSKRSSCRTIGRCLLGDVGAAQAHGHADVRLLQRRGVVDAVAEHRDDLAALLQRLDDQQLVLRRDPAEGVDIGDAAGELRADSSRSSSRPSTIRAGPSIRPTARPTASAVAR